MLAYQPNAFLAFSLPLLSHLLFPSSFAVGPHRRSLSPGPHVTINNQLAIKIKELQNKKLVASYLVVMSVHPLISQILYTHLSSLFLLPEKVWHIK